VHVVDRWCYLGTFRTEDELLQRDLFERRAAFDMDTYKLLVAHLMRNRRARVMPLAEAGSALRTGARH
jgi:DNA polymerase-3 subunit epsilon